MADHDNPLERAVELFVYAPIGLAMFAKDTVPTFLKMFVSRGQTEVTQRRKTAGSQAGQYKTIGQMAVKYGGPEVKRHAEAAADTVIRRAEETIATIATVTAPPTPRTTAPAPPTPPPAAPSTPSSTSNGTGELPIPDYDLLSASQVIDRLDGLTPTELAGVRGYETAHRGRTTILAKISQLSP